MKIRISLTNKEFDLLARIEKGDRITIRDTETAQFNTMNDAGLITPADGWSLTELGRMALHQNAPMETKVEKPTDAAYAHCVAYWLKDFHLGWSFGGVQGKALKSIISKLRERSTDRTDATVVATFKKLCQSLPEWFKDKDLPVINSKFNEIITQIQRGPNKGGWHQQNSAERMFGGY